MPVSVSSSIDGNTARIIVSLDQAASGAKGVQINAELNIENATYAGDMLLLPGTRDTSESEADGVFSLASEISLDGPVGAGADILTYEFDITGPGAIQITSFVVLTDTFESSLSEQADLISFSFDGGDTLPEGTPGPDLLTGRPINDNLLGLAGNDTFEASAGVDTLDGGEGIDLAAMNGPRDSYTLNVTTTGISIYDRREDGDGVNALIDIEQLTFEGDAGSQPLDLTKFGGAASLSTEDFLALTELYIAYYDRAPDALGLNFWGTVFASGLTLDAIALDFASQPETQAVYPDGTSNEDFVIAVYGNVLGRDPDTLGLGFWEGQLTSGNIGRDAFILRLLEGAKAPPPADATQDFITQQLADQSYLNEKSKAGAYYSVLLGMSDLDDADAVMQAFGDAASQNLIAARNVADAAFDTANDPVGGEFLMPIVGVLGNDFFADFFAM